MSFYSTFLMTWKGVIINCDCRLCFCQRFLSRSPCRFFWMFLPFKGRFACHSPSKVVARLELGCRKCVSVQCSFFAVSFSSYSPLSAVLSAVPLKALFPDGSSAERVICTLRYGFAHVGIRRRCCCRWLLVTELQRVGFGGLFK